jgi:hypothetical protein
MWNVFNCYLSGRHDYGMWCEPGTIFLRCLHCGKRSAGWAVNATAPVTFAPPAPAPTVVRATAPVVHAAAPVRRSRVLPFDRAAAAR